MSIFTKRHYVWFASVCRDIVTLDITSPEQREGKGYTRDRCNHKVISALADALASESLAFNRGLFLHNVFCTPQDHTWQTNCPFQNSLNPNPHT